MIFTISHNRIASPHLSLKPGHWSFLAFRFDLKYQLIILKPAHFQTGSYTILSPGSWAFRLRVKLHCTLSWVSACQLQILGPLSLCDYVGLFPVTNLLVSIYIVLVTFLWKALNNTGDLSLCYITLRFLYLPLTHQLEKLQPF